ncbi:uncharacterized protein K452DRAFT_303472 [Aplosporella prunicola CBS 121167]|uniref:Uncharacterized protein n=1 Tax=Aplosporella prunicola CBS 121167 TaxID=1176127 RepID=A0A6A6AX93_9PEZI|nr:uncharacterized protein K452DRAFT_303472 [Aplosporella prunicola CBS 121167]KAF2135544.1 hypothetical protein K452DRAFT_303472 [Aplosporella prunicola CBS 121167]
MPLTTALVVRGGGGGGGGVAGACVGAFDYGVWLVRWDGSRHGLVDCSRFHARCAKSVRKLYRDAKVRRGGLGVGGRGDDASSLRDLGLPMPEDYVQGLMGIWAATESDIVYLTELNADKMVAPEEVRRRRRRRGRRKGRRRR